MYCRSLVFYCLALLAVAALYAYAVPENPNVKPDAVTTYNWQKMFYWALGYFVVFGAVLIVTGLFGVSQSWSAALGPPAPWKVRMDPTFEFKDVV